MSTTAIGDHALMNQRMLSTVDAIEERLTDERGLVYRYLWPPTD